MLTFKVSCVMSVVRVYVPCLLVVGVKSRVRARVRTVTGDNVITKLWESSGREIDREI